MVFEVKMEVPVGGCFYDVWNKQGSKGHNKINFMSLFKFFVHSIVGYIIVKL